MTSFSGNSHCWQENSRKPESCRVQDSCSAVWAPRPLRWWVHRTACWRKTVCLWIYLDGQMNHDCDVLKTGFHPFLLLIWNPWATLWAVTWKKPPSLCLWYLLILSGTYLEMEKELMMMMSCWLLIHYSEDSSPQIFLMPYPLKSQEYMHIKLFHHGFTTGQPFHPVNLLNDSYVCMYLPVHVFTLVNQVFPKHI